MPSRWLVMAGHVPPGGSLGGIVRYTLELSKALQRRPDIELHLLTSPQAENSLAQIVGCEGRTLAMPRVPGPTVSLVERYLLARKLSGFDVVLGAKHLLPRGVRALTVLTVHDMLLYDRPQDFSTTKRHLLRGPYAASLRQADVLACVSQATRDRVVSFAPGLADRSVVIPLATSPTLLEAPAQAVEAVADRPFALVVGDSQPRKNIATVVSAWKRVAAWNPEALLLLVGPPPWGVESYGPDYADLVTSGNIRQLTGVSDAVLRWCYENARVVLAPSIAEGFGLPAVEALDLGAPLITSQDAALVEASRGRALHVPTMDVQAWAAAVIASFSGDRRPTPPPAGPTRSWDDVAAETVRSVGFLSTARSPVSPSAAG